MKHRIYWIVDGTSGNTLVYGEKRVAIDHWDKYFKNAGYTLLRIEREQ
jgi:hypothetical protein